MLAIPPGKTCYVATCDEPGCTERAELDETDYDDAAFDLRRIGWLPFPRSGVGKERWPWKCKAHVPKATGSMGPSTGTQS